MADDVRVYILTFTVQPNSPNLLLLQRYLLDSVDVLGYWNYIPLVYCVKSRLTAAELTMKLDVFFPLGGFMIAEINKYNINGRLPSMEAWNWFYAPARTEWGGALPQPTLANLLALTDSKK